MHELSDEWQVTRLSRESVQSIRKPTADQRRLTVEGADKVT